jgi:Fic family protein
MSERNFSSQEEILMPKKSWQPKYNYSEVIVKALMEIEGAKAVIDHVTLPPAVENELRHRTRVRSSHFSTFIEGNRLTLSEVAELLEGNPAVPQNRERDVLEVRNYWNALLKVEKWASSKTTLTEKSVRQLHAILEKGKRAKPTSYRDGQNAVRDSITRDIVYMPPEAEDVPILMAEMISWINRAEKENIPVPIIAALIHYQLGTIHPFWDGNGRTARLLATFILNRGGYGINGFLSLEEHHARDLTGYYDSLMVHPNHNYYMGRADASLNKWLEYFLKTLAFVFTVATIFFPLAIAEVDSIIVHNVINFESGAIPSDEQGRTLKALEKKITEKIKYFPRGAFIRLGSRSPKDSYEAHQRKYCYHAGQEAVKALCDSERVHDDLWLARSNDYTPYIVVREWVIIQPWQEFRCFVRGRKLVGISQYNYLNHEVFSEIIDNADRIEWTLRKKIEQVAPLLLLDDIVVDLVYKAKGIGNTIVNTAILLEVNPYSPYTDPCLFNWSKDSFKFFEFRYFK